MKVIKLGGRVQSDLSLPGVIGQLWSSAPGQVCIVHGGGDEISTLQRALGREPCFVNGRRITTDQDMELVRMVLSGTANKRLVASLSSQGIKAVGISGEDGGLLLAEPIDAGRFGKSGRPVRAEIHIIDALAASGFLPVISPVATNAESAVHEPLNVNGDDAAAVIAAALKAELWLVADVAGVLDENQNLIGTLDQAMTESLVADGTVNSGMQAKLEAGFTALATGASAVRIADIDALTGKGEGTLLSLTPSMT